MHLIVIQNGLNGHHSLMKSVCNYYETRLSKENVRVIASDVNNFWNTHDGIEAMGSRLYKFVLEQIVTRPSVDSISFIGHSLGGLMIRSCVEKLGLHKLKDGSLFFEKIKPVAYISIASPHGGIEESPHWRKIAARFVIGKTGMELLQEDETQLLRKMNEPQNMNALQLFSHKVLYGNAFGDIVSFKSACLAPKDFSEIVQGHEKCKIYDISACFSLPFVRKAVDFSDCYMVHNYIINRGLTTQTLVLDDTLQYLKK